MGYWYDVDEYRRWPLLLTGAAVGALLVGLIWFVHGLTNKGVREEQPFDSARVVDSSRSDSGQARNRMARCIEVFEAQTDPLRATEASLSQWELHVGAMNQFVTGAITLEQAKAFWSESRSSVADLLERRAAAMEKYAQRTARCPLTEPGTMTADLSRCAEAVAARGMVLDAASVAHASWREHVQQTEMVRTGELSADEMVRQWLANPQDGEEGLSDYRSAADDAEGQTC
jgi:hypothetical protein